MKATKFWNPSSTAARAVASNWSSVSATAPATLSSTSKTKMSSKSSPTATTANVWSSKWLIAYSRLNTNYNYMCCRNITPRWTQYLHPVRDIKNYYINRQLKIVAITRIIFSPETDDTDQECAKTCYPDCKQIRYEIDYQDEGPMVNKETTLMVLNWGSFEYLTLKQDWEWSFSTLIGALGGAIGAYICSHLIP